MNRFDSDVMAKVAEKIENLSKAIGFDGNMDEFKKGLKVEKEHGPAGPENGKYDETHGSQTSTAQIAGAHLSEIPDYYTRLKKMEDAAKK